MAALTDSDFARHLAAEFMQSEEDALLAHQWAAGAFEGAGLTTATEPIVHHIQQGALGCTMDAVDALSYPCAKKINDLALIFYPTADHNQAYQQGTELPTRLKTMSDDYHVEFRRVDTVEKALNIALDLVSIGREIKYLELAGHGNPRSIEFSKSDEGRATTASGASTASQLEMLVNLVAKDGFIVTQSCQNGVKLAGGEKNMLEHIASTAKGRWVLGTTGSSFNMEWDSYKPVGLRFVDLETKQDITSIEIA